MADIVIRRGYSPLICDVTFGTWMNMGADSTAALDSLIGWVLVIFFETKK